MSTTQRIRRGLRLAISVTMLKWSFRFVPLRDRSPVIGALYAGLAHEFEKFEV